MHIELAVAVAAVVVAVIAAVIAYRYVTPRARLVVGMTTTSLSVQSAAPGVSDRVTIQHADFGVLQNPAAVRILLADVGRVDVTSSHFDGGHPLALEIGAHILDPLETIRNNRPDQILPPRQIIESGLLVGPGLISRGQRLELEYLVDGDAHLQIASHSLREADVIISSWDGSPTRIMAGWVATTFASMLFVFPLFMVPELYLRLRIVYSLFFGGLLVVVFAVVRGSVRARRVQRARPLRQRYR